jgi:hypothetical protein
LLRRQLLLPALVVSPCLQRVALRVRGGGLARLRLLVALAHVLRKRRIGLLNYSLLGACAHRVYHGLHSVSPLSRQAVPNFNSTMRAVKDLLT